MLDQHFQIPGLEFHVVIEVERNVRHERSRALDARTQQSGPLPLVQVAERPCRRRYPRICQSTQGDIADRTVVDHEYLDRYPDFRGLDAGGLDCANQVTLPVPGATNNGLIGVDGRFTRRGATDAAADATAPAATRLPSVHPRLSLLQST